MLCLYFFDSYIRLTTEVPSWNLVLNTLFALVNIPSFNETTINWAPLNLVLIK